MPRLPSRHDLLATFADAALTTACLSILVFIDIPLTIYSGNMDAFPGMTVAEYVSSILPFWGWGSLAVLLLCFGASLFSHSRLPALVLLAISGLGWVNATLLNWDYGPLVGVSITFIEHGLWAVTDCVVWLGALAATIYFRYRLFPYIRTVSTSFLGVMICAQLVGVLTGDIDLGQWGEEQGSTQSTVAFSPQINALVITLDMTQADIAAEVLAENPLLAQGLDGFVFFQNTTGVAATTSASVPVMMGSPFQENKDKISARAVTSAPPTKPSPLGVLGELSKLNFDICQDGAVAPQIAPWAAKCTPMNNADRSGAMLADLSLFRVSPLPLKPLIYNNQHWLLSTKLVPDGEVVNEGHPQGVGMDIRAFHYLTNNSVLSANSPPRMMWMHFLGTHNPIQLTRECGLYQQPGIEQREEVKNQFICYLGKTIEFLDRLRKIGAYDNSVIIIAADHGGPMGNRNLAFVEPRKAFFGDIHIPDAVLTAGTPLFMVKPIGAQGPLQTSITPASLCDIPAILREQIGLAPNDRAWCENPLHLPPDSQRQRRFMFYRWNEDVWNLSETGFPNIDEFFIQGDSATIGAWHPSLRRYPNADGVPAWQKLYPGELTAYKYLSAYGWELPDKPSRQAGAMAMGAVGHLYLERTLSGPAEIQIRLSSALPEPVTLDVGTDNQTLCSIQVDPARTDQMARCPLGKSQSAERLTFSVSGVMPQARAKVLISEITIAENHR